MLNWLEEEKQYVDKAVEHYLKEQSKMPLGFMMSRKTLNKNIEKVKKEATDRYRYEKLRKYELEIIEERKRIDNLVNDINNKFGDYMYKLSNLISRDIKPFKMVVKEYDNLDVLSPKKLERVDIQCEPFRLSFIQEKISKGSV